MRTTSTARRVHTVVTSPIGPLTLVAADGTLCGLYLEQQRHLPPEDTFGEPDDEPFGEVQRQLGEYFRAVRSRFDLDVVMFGTPFQLAVWQALRDIPHGETVSYGRLADRLGVPTASRAVGLANGRNPISVIVPCHRVVGSTGALTGYGGGLERKRYLLDFESTGGGLFAPGSSEVGPTVPAWTVT